MYCICTYSVDSGLTRGGCDIITGAKLLRGGKIKGILMYIMTIYCESGYLYGNVIYANFASSCVGA